MPTILITGAGRGLGRELARQYAEDGWRVIGTVRSPAAHLPEAITLDVTDTRQAKRLSLQLKGVAIDVLFCNAGALIDNVAASERKTVAVMSSRLGSIAETSGATLPYSTSKAALNLLAKGLAANLAPRGVIVVALSPGWVKTDMGGESAPLTPDTTARAFPGRDYLATRIPEISTDTWRSGCMQATFFALLASPHCAAWVRGRVSPLALA